MKQRHPTLTHNVMLYRAWSGSLNFYGHQNGSDFDDREKSHIASIWQALDRRKMSYFDDRKNSHNLTGRAIRWIFFLLPLYLQASVCYFVPPPGWSCAGPKNLSPHVHIGFIGSGSAEFKPSINLATEKVDISLKEYVQAVKNIHLSEANTQWRDLGKFKLAAGDGRLTEISSRSPVGEIKMLQALFVQGKTAYVLTAAVLKKDYAAHQKELLQALQSLTLVSDLYAALPQNQRFQEFFDSLASRPPKEQLNNWKLAQWTKLQTLVQEESAQMGSHWQFLALKEGHEKIYHSKD